ncbi:coiled-coil domain-containing protein-domain-containing protein [Myxozyma melibiosi]|uniref:Coiled-coil domain-containing protein-domain-containing protein n=1 Tax=Myxozyma melibiosi TaxID=54550 RepID=A0ABR1FCL2_9ASCO
MSAASSGSMDGSGQQQQQQLPAKTIPARLRRHKTITNRRLHYLQKHTPDYFYSSGLAEASPLLYDRLVRRFQTPAEREVETDRRGWAGRMYEDLMRAERRLDKIEKEKAEELRRQEMGDLSNSNDDEATTQVYGEEEEAGDLVVDAEISSKEEGIQQWEKLMTLRFLSGLDTDFDYDGIDFDEEWDDYVQINRDKEDDYFDSEEPTWCYDDTDDSVSERPLNGQTGVQDF